MRRLTISFSAFCLALLGLILLANTSVSHAEHLVSPKPAAWPGDVAISTEPKFQGAGWYGHPGIQLVPDGKGGAFVAWDDTAWARVFLQHLDENGLALWGANGGLVAPQTLYQFSPRMTGDGAGGTIVAWVDGRAGVCNFKYAWDCNIFAQRVAPDGHLLWASGGVTVTAAADNQGTNGVAIVSDGAGGAIVAWNDYRQTDPYRIYAQHLDGQGRPLWATDGIPITPPATVFGGMANFTPLMVADGAGGAIIGWINEQVDLNMESPPLSVQHVNGSGQLLWGSKGITVGLPTREYFAMTADGSGGAFLAWGGGGPSVFDNILAQHVNGSGQPVWQSGGLTIADAPDYQMVPDIVGDGLGGAFIVWQDGRNQDPGLVHQGCTGLSSMCDIYAQRVSSSGTILWQANGLAISTAPNEQLSPRVVSPAPGTALVVWEDCRDAPSLACMENSKLYAQKVSATGQRQWTANGVRVSAGTGTQGLFYGSDLTPGFMMAGSGGDAFLAWADGRNGVCEWSAELGTEAACDLYGAKLSGLDSSGSGGGSGGSPAPKLTLPLILR